MGAVRLTLIALLQLLVAKLSLEAQTRTLWLPQLVKSTVAVRELDVKAVVVVRTVPESSSRKLLLLPEQFKPQPVAPQFCVPPSKLQAKSTSIGRSIVYALVVRKLVGARGGKLEQGQ